MPWIQLSHHLEAVAAVLMGCLTALRSVFVGHFGDRSSKRGYFYYRFRKLVRPSSDDEKRESSSVQDDKAEFLRGPQTGATLHGLRSFIRRHERPSGNTTVQTNLSLKYDPIEEYHNFCRDKDVGRTIPTDSLPTQETDSKPPTPTVVSMQFPRP